MCSARANRKFCQQQSSFCLQTCEWNPPGVRKDLSLCFSFLWLASSRGLSTLLWNSWHQLLSHADLLTPWIISFCAEICVNVGKALLRACNGGHVLPIGEGVEIGFAQITTPHMETSVLKETSTYWGRVARASSAISARVPEEHAIHFLGFAETQRSRLCWPQGKLLPPGIILGMLRRFCGPTNHS